MAARLQLLDQSVSDELRQHTARDRARARRVSPQIATRARLLTTFV